MSADVKFCGNCGARLRPSSRFCVECGTTVTAFTPPAAEPAATPLEEQETIAVAPTAAGVTAPATPWTPPAAPSPGQGLPGPYGQAPIASLGRRALAVIVDGIALVGVYWLVGSLIANTTDDTTEFGFSLSGGPAALVLLIMTVVSFGYFIVLEGSGGATLGKMGFGIRVERSSGGTISFGASAVRNVLRIVDGIGGYLVGWIVALTSPRRQRIGDRAAGTVVVKAPRARPLAAFGAVGAGVLLVIAGSLLRNPAANVTLEATLAENTTGDFQPVNPTSRFNPNAQVFHLTFLVSGAAAGSEIRSVWIAENVGNAAQPNTVIDEATITLSGGSERGAFRLRRGPNPWPLGSYRVEIFIDDELVETLSFTVAR